MNIGILLDKLDANQIAFYAINHINTLTKQNSKDKYVLFYREKSSIWGPCLSTITTFDRMFTFEGAIISTTLDLSIFMMKAYTPSVRIYYPFDLEWIRGYGNFMMNASLMRNKDMKIISPSREYDNAIFNYCGRRSDAVISRFNLKQISEFICNLQ